MLISDTPIDSAKDDLLNRAEFSNTLANAIIAHNANEAFTIGVNGKWGSGKTSVLNMVLERISASRDDRNPVAILRFNPWLCTEVTQLVSQFFIQLSATIGSSKKDFRVLCERIEEYAEVLEAIPVAGKIMSTVARRTARNYLKRSAKSLQLIKEEIIQELTNKKVKIVVAIDDIDRLSSEEICGVFQLVKSLADFPRMVYVLAMDPYVVEQALNEVQKGSGREYLQKIVQVPFDLPAPNKHDIYKVLFRGLDSVFGDIDKNEWDSDLWSVVFHTGIKHYLNSIRDVVRLVNILSLKYSLLKEEVDKIDLIGVTCLQVFEPSAFSRLFAYKDLLCDENSFMFEQQEKVKALTNVLDDISSDVSIGAKAQLSALVSELFPVLKSIHHHGYVDSGTTSKQKSLANRSISHIACFDRYFSLALEHNATSRADIQYFLQTADAQYIGSWLVKRSESSRICLFLDDIQAHIDTDSIRISSERTSCLFVGLATNWHLLKRDYDESPLNLPYDWRLLRISDSLLKRLKFSERLVIIKEVFDSRSIALTTQCLLLRHLQNQHGRFAENNSRVEEPAVSMDTLLELEKLFVDRTIVEMDSGKIVDYPRFLSIIWLAEKIAPEAVNERKDTLIKDDPTLAKLISALTTKGTASGLVTRPFWRIGKESVEVYIEPRLAYERLAKFVKSKLFADLSDDVRERVAAFLISMEQQGNDGAFGGEITIESISDKLSNAALGNQ